MKHVLITGGGGFIGRHVTQELLGHGYSVRILDALVEQVHGENSVELPPGAELVRGDVRDRRTVADALNRYRPAIDGARPRQE